MRSKIFTFFVTSFFLTSLYAQFNFLLNHSFEGEMCFSSLSEEWIICKEKSTSDVQYSHMGSTFPVSDGNTSLGLMMCGSNIPYQRLKVFKPNFLQYWRKIIIYKFEIDFVVLGTYEEHRGRKIIDGEILPNRYLLL